MYLSFYHVCAVVIQLLLHGVLCIAANASEPWIQYPPSGYATLTHYTLPENYIAACGCTGESTYYPTAALNQMAYGSSYAYGPACGVCFNLTLLNTFLSKPPFYPNVSKSIVIKVTDKCPLSTTGWCNGTANGPNAAGNYLNFDLAYPSVAIPSDFFPSDPSLYGYTDFGVWNISYRSVSCESNWAGSSNPAALGSVANEGTSVCCPANPTGSANDTCPSFSEQNGVPPDTTTNSGSRIAPRQTIFIYLAISYILLLVIP